MTSPQREASRFLWPDRREAELVHEWLTTSGARGTEISNILQVESFSTVGTTLAHLSYMIKMLGFVGFTVVVGLSAACSAPVEDVAQGTSQSVVTYEPTTGTLAKCDLAKDSDCRSGDPILVTAKGRVALKARDKANVPALALLMSDELLGAKVKLNLASHSAGGAREVFEDRVAVSGTYEELGPTSGQLTMANRKTLPVRLSADSYVVYLEGPNEITGFLVRNAGKLTLDVGREYVVRVPDSQ